MKRSYLTPSQGHTYALVLTPRKGEMLIDSRLLANHLGNQHKAVSTMIERYADDFRSLGVLTFEMEKPGNVKGGRPERFALLNEDQAYFLLVLSRNTSRAVALKARLVRAFREARQVAALHKTEYLPVYHQLHDHIHALAAGSANEKFVHMNVNRLVNKVAGVDAGERAKAPLHQQSLLTVAQTVAVAAMSDAPDHHVGYQKAKEALNALHTCCRGLSESVQRLGEFAHVEELQAQ